jgi:hypothetical protein
MATSPITTSMNTSFDFLRWSMFLPPSFILVASNPSSLTTPTLTPFPSHSIASEPATEEPLHTLALSIPFLDNYDADGFTAPEPCLVRASQRTC